MKNDILLYICYWHLDFTPNNLLSKSNCFLDSYNIVSG